MQIVDAVLKGTPASQVAKANDLHPDFKKYQKDAFAGRGNAYTESAKVSELQRQLGQLAAENIVLKKALGRIKELAREKGELLCSRWRRNLRVQWFRRHMVWYASRTYCSLERCDFRDRHSIARFRVTRVKAMCEWPRRSRTFRVSTRDTDTGRSPANCSARGFR